MLGVLYLCSGNLALVIGAHAAFNITSNLLFARAGGPTDGLSVLMRLEVESSLPLLASEGVLEFAAFGLLGLLGLLWLRVTRGTVSIDLTALELAEEPGAPTPGLGVAAATVLHYATTLERLQWLMTS